MKIFNESFANIINFPDMKRDVTLVLLHFFTAKDLMDADSRSLNSTTAFVFLQFKHSVVFWSIS